jgi:hypothetical protein
MPQKMPLPSWSGIPKGGIPDITAYLPSLHGHAIANRVPQGKTQTPNPTKGRKNPTIWEHIILVKGAV